MGKNNGVTPKQKEEIVDLISRAFKNDACIMVLPVIEYFKIRGLNPFILKNVTSLIEKGMMAAIEKLPASEDEIQRIYEEIAAF